MRSHRLSALAATALLSALAFSGCSGDDSSEPPADAASEATGTNERDEDGVLDDGSGDKQRNCKVTLEVSGDVEASWRGKGQSVQPANESPAAYYTAQKNGQLIQVFAAGGDIETSSATVTIDDKTYTTDPTSAEGVDAGEDGLTASVEAEAISTDEGGVDVLADFKCGTEMKQNKSKN